MAIQKDGKNKFLEVNDKCLDAFMKLKANFMLTQWLSRYLATSNLYVIHNTICYKWKQI